MFAVFKRVWRFSEGKWRRKPTSQNRLFAEGKLCLLPDLGRRWRVATDEGWRSLYCIKNRNRNYIKIPDSFLLCRGYRIIITVFFPHSSRRYIRRESPRRFWSFGPMPRFRSWSRKLWRGCRNICRLSERGCGGLAPRTNLRILQNHRNCRRLGRWRSDPNIPPRERA